METTTLLVWTRVLANDGESGDETEPEVASVQVFRNTDGKLTPVSFPVDKDFDLDDYTWLLDDLEEGTTVTERLERWSVELPVRAEEFDLDLLEYYAGAFTCEYNEEEFEVEDGNGTCYGATYKVENGAFTEAD